MFLLLMIIAVLHGFIMLYKSDFFYIYCQFHSMVQTPSAYDSVLFIHHTTVGMVILLLYVDDMIITSSNSTTVSKVKLHLFREFEMKDLGHLHYFLGIEERERERERTTSSALRKKPAKIPHHKPPPKTTRS